MNSPLSLLPCSSEIWLPDEDSLLNIESELIIPESGLSSQLVLDYEYKFANSTDIQAAAAANNTTNNNGMANSIRYGTYRSKVTNSTRAELKPDGVMLVHVTKTNESCARFGLGLKQDGDADLVVNNVEIGAEAHRIGLFQVCFIKIAVFSICL